MPKYFRHLKRVVRFGHGQLTLPLLLATVKISRPAEKDHKYSESTLRSMRVVLGLTLGGRTIAFGFRRTALRKGCEPSRGMLTTAGPLVSATARSRSTAFSLCHLQIETCRSCASAYSVGPIFKCDTSAKAAAKGAAIASASRIP
jgi:hypothetical protein